ncbi:MAG TPA: zinc ribbon domain-containing protein, partial [Actinomycetota bacterium]|nr:zinc ribbon domain-containing protein [Actinomycetota bacterium]
ARPASSGAPGIRASERGAVWDCPTCGTVNPIDATFCRACGTAFGKLLQQPEARARTDPGRATAYSMLFPGLGHTVAGRAAEGAARAVIFAYAAATAIIILVMTDGGPGPFVSLLIASALVAGGLYVVSAVDAGRAARGEPQLITPRILLYGGAGLILLTVVVLVIVGIRAGPRVT